jgi:hypothetical protein
MTEPVSGTNLGECEDQNRFKVQAVPLYRFGSRNMCSLTPGGTRVPG